MAICSVILLNMAGGCVFRSWGTQMCPYLLIGFRISRKLYLHINLSILYNAVFSAVHIEFVANCQLLEPTHWE